MRRILKNYPITKVVPVFLLALFMSVILTSCTEKNTERLPVIEDYDKTVAETEKTHIRFGIVTGPYGDMFREAIQPILAQKGYTFEIVLYKDYVQPNLALANNEIDLNMFQNYRYLNEFKFEHNLDLSAITEIPTASMGVFSYKYKALDDLKNKTIVSIPNDPTNLSRALLVLEQAGIIRLNSSIDKNRSTVKDITHNPKNLLFYPLEAQKLVQSLNEYDMSVINGNFALANGLDLSGALYNEVLSGNYMNVIAVRTEDLGKLFVQDIIDAVSSESFKNSITNVNGKYGGFQLPRSFSDDEFSGVKSKGGNT